jgi:hypothetical protein
MALGDGIRRNILSVSPAERQRFVTAIVELNNRKFPGSRTDFPAGGVSYWFKMDEIHQATHVHGGPAFLPWHRELCNYFESLLREVDPDLSLHYWDWNQSISPLFPLFGNTSGEAGEPWLSAKFYDPAAPGDNWRDETVHGNPFTPTWSGSYALHGNPADPPKNRARNVQSGIPPVGTANWPGDSAFIGALIYSDFDSLMQGPTGNAHSQAHSWLGLGNAHTSFRDPLVFLLHSNVDRLWAMWQTQPGHTDRLDPNQVYGALGSDPEINEPLQPWAGTGPWPTRPWYTPENLQFTKTCKHPTVVRPPCYDTLPISPPTITLETPSINFNAVPVGETAARAIVFSALSCDDVHLSITAGPTVLTGPAGTAFGTFPAPLGTSVMIPHISSVTPPKGRLWISYRGTAAGDSATGTVTVHCAETGQDFVINIAANTIARPTVAVMLVLDQSGSMDWLAGIDATTKRIDVLHQAAAQFVQLAQDSSRVGDGVGMVSFDHNAYPGIGVTRNNGTGFDLGPVATAIQNLHPAGATSIGNGVALGRNTLNPVTGYDQKAMVVFTDGLENTPLMIADVLGSINDRTFAIGLGTAQQVSVGALTALAHNTGGRLLLSGRLSPAIDDYFRLSKFFMQVLAGVTNTDIVTDPSGFIAPGMKVRIPFVLNETDIDSTVILLTDLRAIRFFIETPAGELMDPVRAGALGQTYATGTNLNYYRFTLPLPLGAQPAHAGTWHALLEVDDATLKRLAHASDQSFAVLQSRMVHGIRYNLSVQAYSNLRMAASLSQNSLQPGATLTVRASLAEYGIPVDHRAGIYAELERPDGSRTSLVLAEVEPGSFETSTVAAIQGVYRFRLLASGVTLRGLPFAREQNLTGSVVLGGDNPLIVSGPSGRGRDRQMCELFECLLRPEALGRFFAEHNINPDAVRGCIERWCKERLGSPSEEEIREREGTAAPPSAPGSPPATAFTTEQIALLTEMIRHLQQAGGRLTRAPETKGPDTR